MMVLGQCSPKRCRSGVIEGMEHWGGSDEVTLPTSIVATQVEPTASCSVPHPLCALGLAVRDTSPPALQTVLDASKDAHQSVERATIALPSSATEDSRQKSMQRVLVRASNLTPPKVLLHRAPGSVPSPTGFACSPECLGDQHQHESPSWSAPSPGEPKVLAEPSNDFVSSYDPAGWPAGDAQHLSPAYDLSTACAELNSLESSDDTSDNPPVYPKSDWRALELCVNQPNATWIGATLVGETRDHQCRLIIAETGAEMKVGWDQMGVLLSENPPGIRQYNRTSSALDSNKLEAESSLRRLMTLRTDGPDWQSIARSMINAGHDTNAAACRLAWLELMQRKPPGSLPAEDLEKRFWSRPGRRVDLFDGDCWCSGITAIDSDAMAGRSTINLDSGETVTISLPDKRVRVSLLFPPSSILDSIRFIRDAVRTAADVALVTLEGSETKHCSLRDLVLLIRGRQESRTLQQPAPAMASEQMAADLISILHPSQVVRGVSIDNEIGATVVSLAGVTKIMQCKGVHFDRLRLSKIDTQLINAMSIRNDGCKVRHLHSPSQPDDFPVHSTTVRHHQSRSASCDRSAHSSNATSPTTQVHQSISLYSGRLRVPPQRLDPCQPANQLSAPAESCGTKTIKAATRGNQNARKIAGTEALAKDELPGNLKDLLKSEAVSGQKRCYRNIDIPVNLSAQTAKNSPSSLQGVNGSSPRTPVVRSNDLSRMLGHVSCSALSQEARSKTEDSPAEDTASILVSSNCETCELGTGRSRHRNGSDHLVDITLIEDSTCIANRDVAHKKHSTAINRRNQPQETCSTFATSNRRITRSSGILGKRLQRDHATSEKQQGNPESAPGLTIKPQDGLTLGKKLFPSGGAVVRWTTTELELLEKAVATQDKTEVDWKSVSAVVGRTPEACYARHGRNHNKWNQKSDQKCRYKRNNA